MSKREHTDDCVSSDQHDRVMGQLDEAKARLAGAVAAYENKVQDFAVETWVVSKAHEWSTTRDHKFNGDLADVGVDRGRWLAKAELLVVLEDARNDAPARGYTIGGHA